MATTYNVTSADWFKPTRPGGRVGSGPEDASQTFLRGDLLVYNGATSGHQDRLKVASANPTSVVGIALGAATGVTDNPTPIAFAETGQEFIGVTNTADVIALTDKGLSYGVVIDATNKIWRVDKTNTTTTVVTITELYDAPGTTSGRVIFQFKAAVRDPYVN